MKRFYQLDGIRSIAIFLVLASHTASFGLYAQGGLGVVIFFTLSGFLTMLPYINKNRIKFSSFKDVLEFYIKRIFRIIPLYYLILIGSFIIDRGLGINSIRILLKNMLFIECNSHLWFLQQEMVFYLITPILLYILDFLKNKLRFNNIIIAIILIFLGTLFNVFVTNDILYLNGNGQHQQLRLGIFLVGMAFGFIYKEYIEKSKKELELKKIVILDIISSVILLSFFISAEKYISYINPNFSGLYVGWKFPITCALITGILIFNVLINKKGIITKILSIKLFREISKLTYAVYLSHMFLLKYFLNLNAIRQFFVVGFLSLGIALILNNTVERWSSDILKKYILKQ